MPYQEIQGDLIELAKSGQFDIITHGCNCFCKMGRGIAPLMDDAFGCNDPNKYQMEDPAEKGNVNKLGTIEPKIFIRKNGSILIVINSYTQYYYGPQYGKLWRYDIPLDYDALTLCLRKINLRYAGKAIGLPKIGCDKGGGDWDRVKLIIKRELVNMLVTVVMRPPKTKSPSMVEADSVPFDLDTI